jgi:hypothetical protein
MGRVKSLKFDKEKILNIWVNDKGYSQVTLCKNGKPKHFKLHRLVALMFIPNPKNKPEVNHDDGNKENCCVTNLYWATKSENIRHAFDNGLNKHIKQIKQYDINGNFIKEWNCIMDIQKALNIANSNIVACCKGKYKTAGGYIWRYKGTQ